MNKFASNIIGAYGHKGKTWLANLDTLTQDISRDLELENVTKIDSLSYNYVLFAEHKLYKNIVLKIGINLADSEREARALIALKSDVLVSLLEAKPGVLVLERVIDGLPLETARIQNKIEICCDLVDKLHHNSEPPSQHNFPHINQQLDWMDQDWSVPQELLGLARKLKNKLRLAQGHREILLHGDLHRANILRSGKSWKIIDPKGVVGHKVNEAWACVKEFEQDTHYIANYFKWNVQWVREWYFVHLMLSAIWNVQDNIKPNLFLNKAKRIYQKLSFKDG